MHRLDSGLSVLRPLIAEMTHHLSVHAQVDGGMPGWVYVDDPAHPRSAFAHNNEGWYLTGEANNRAFNGWLRGFLQEHVLRDALRYGEDVPLHFFPDGWEQVGAEILPPQTYTVDYQKYFRFTGPLYTPSDDLPDGCVLRPVDAELLAQKDRFPVSRLRNWASGGFGTLEAFLAAGIGMCLERDGQIVCWCMPDCATGDGCELGIHTLETERRRGYAAITVAATVAGCLARGFTHIGWHCWSANDSSARLAQKVGFTHVLNHPAFIVQPTSDPV